MTEHKMPRRDALQLNTATFLYPPRITVSRASQTQVVVGFPTLMQVR